MTWLLPVLALFMLVDGALGARGKPGLVNRALVTVPEPYSRWSVVGVYLAIACVFLLASIGVVHL